MTDGVVKISKMMADAAIMQSSGTTIDGGEFVFQTTSVDPSDKEPVAVWFKIGSSRGYVIDVTGGNVRVGTTNFNAKGIASMVLAFVIPANQEPFVGTIADLTREKIGKLIQVAIAEG